MRIFKRFLSFLLLLFFFSCASSPPAPGEEKKKRPVWPEHSLENHRFDPDSSLFARYRETPTPQSMSIEGAGKKHRQRGTGAAPGFLLTAPAR